MGLRRVTSSTEREVSPRRARARRILLPAFLVVVTAAVLVVGVLPTRTYLDKRAEVGAAELQLAELEQSNTQAQAQAERLDTDAEIERVARRDYGMANPGEEIYVVLPPPAEPVEIPTGWPFSKLHTQLDADS